MLGLGLLASQFVGRQLVAVTMRGTSMEPTYRHGDRVIGEPEPFSAAT